MIRIYEFFGIKVVEWEIPLLVIGIAVWGLVFILRTWTLLIALYRRIMYKHKTRGLIETEGVTILKPLKGVDENLKDNLESFFLLDYPTFEILFSIANDTDPAKVVVDELIQKYPNVNAKLIISEPSQSLNPKISNLITSYSKATYNLIWQSDSNIIVQPHVLKHSVSILKKNVGIVHQIPLTTNPKSFAALMEMCYLSTWHSIMYIFFNYVIDTHCAVGKSFLFRKNEFDHYGGFKAYSNYLAEDYFISQHYWKDGFRLGIAPDSSFQNLGEISFSDYWTRQVRWTRIRYSVQPIPTFLEIFSMMVFNGLISFYAFQRLFGIPPLVFAAFHLMIWFTTDVLFGLIFYLPSSFTITTFRYGLNSLRFSLSPKNDFSIFCYNIFRLLISWAAREFLAIPLILHACAGSSVVWRGKTFRIEKGSALRDDQKLN